MAGINDLVLVHIDNKPGFFARIEEIVPDVKPGWWQVKLLVLASPLQIFTWTLDESQIDGEPYTMGGTPVRLEKVVSPLEKKVEPPEATEPGGDSVKGKREPGKVVSLTGRKKK